MVWSGLNEGVPSRSGSPRTLRLPVCLCVRAHLYVCVHAGACAYVCAGVCVPVHVCACVCARCPARADSTVPASTARGLVCAPASKEDLALGFLISQSFSTSASGTKPLGGKVHAVDSQNAAGDI